MSRVVSGAKLELAINNVPVAYTSQVSFSYNLKYEDIREIDNPESVEIAELGTEVELQVSQFRINFNSVRSQGIQPSLKNLLQQPELIATVYNRHDGNTMMTLQGLKLVGRSGSVDARGVFTETLVFRAREFYDEAGKA